MIVIFRFLFLCAALFSAAAGALIIGSLFIPGLTPPGQFIVVSLVVSFVFLGMAMILFGIQKHVNAIAAFANGDASESPPELVTHVKRLLACLLPAGILLCVTLGGMAYGILTRIGQGFAVFG
jgi:hypothetical protein